MRLPRGSGPPIFGPAAERRKTGDPGLGARRRLLSYDREHVPAGAVVMKVRPHHLVVAVAAILVAEPVDAQAPPANKFADVEEYLFDLPQRPEGTIAPVPQPPNLSPRYDPQDSISFTESGAVALKYLVQEDGSITGVEVVASVGSPRLERAAMAVLRRRSPYKSGVLNGVSVPVWEG